MLMILMAIDDEPALLGLIRAVFLDEGWEVEAVGNGVDALRLLDAGATPDAIVLDLAMPELDGRTIFREIRRRGIAAPVLVLSAFGARDARRELGAEGYLEKPFDVDILIGGCRRSFAGLKQASPCRCRSIGESTRVQVLQQGMEDGEIDGKRDPPGVVPRCAVISEILCPASTYFSSA